VPEDKAHPSSGNYQKGKFYADVQVDFEKDEQNDLKAHRIIITLINPKC
jgi:hypothetical protein